MYRVNCNMRIPEGEHQFSQGLSERIQVVIPVIREGRFLGTSFSLLPRKPAIPS